ncbi:hypothetical protein ACN6K9_004238 [Streptomyces sp. SAS_267]|uniref:hypothetical protein n=1 Tax=unclassified Streptomyces TaxID=2593676 RepID=UPI0036FB5FF2
MAACPRTTFVEQVDGLIERYQRRTPALRRIVEAVAVALAGSAGARLLMVLHRLGHLRGRELTGSEKIKAIKALRSQSEAAKKDGTAQAGKTGPWPSVAESFGIVATVLIGMRALAWAVWDVPFNAPHWSDVLFVVQLAFGVALVSRAYKRRRDASPLR